MLRNVETLDLVLAKYAQRDEHTNQFQRHIGGP